MNGLMMDMPLLISDLITHADRHHGDTEIVSKRVEGKTDAGDFHRYTYSDAHTRARRLAKALAGLGVKANDRVATLAWNGYRHFEIYYAVAGAEGVIHTINPRLFPEQVAYIANHAEDKVLFVDLTFVPLLEKVASGLQSVKHFVVMTDRAHMPKTAASSAIANLLCYEDLIEANDDKLEWPTFDEKTASCLCYTSGTTGNPKGVLYSHRSTMLHAYAAALPDALNLSASDAILPVVPGFGRKKKVSTAARRAARLRSRVARNSSVVCHGCSGPTSSARSLVIAPDSTDLITTSSNVEANSMRAALSSSFPR